MPVVIQIQCDRCEAVKQETNHWYIVVADGTSRLSVQPLDHSGASHLVQETKSFAYYCGVHCALAAIADWMHGRVAPRQSGHASSVDRPGQRTQPPPTAHRFSGIARPA